MCMDEDSCIKKYQVLIEEGTCRRGRLRKTQDEVVRKDHWSLDLAEEMTGNYFLFLIRYDKLSEILVFPNIQVCPSKYQ